MIGRNPTEFAASYRSFSTLIEGGFGPSKALEVLAQSAKAEQRLRAGRIAAFVDKGGSLAKALAAQALPELDVAVVDAGERTGTLAQATARLAAHYQVRLEIESAVWRGIPQPVVLFIAAVLSATIPALFRGDLSTKKFLFWTGAPIAILFGVIWVGFEISRRSLYSREIRRWTAEMLELVPILRAFGRELEKERFLTCATLALKAGVDFTTAADILKTVSIGTHLHTAPEMLRRHAPREGYAPALARTGSFSAEEVSSARFGEESGTLALQFEGMAERARERIHVQIGLFQAWFPRILYALVAIIVVAGMALNLFSGR